MTVVQVEKNAEALTMAFVAEFDAPQERVWRLWSDPRQLERWWGPPTWPATFVRHEFEVGGIASYYMTGPDGERMHGWWEITALQAPERIEFLDGFADEEGNRSTEIDPTKGVVTLEDASGRTRMSIVTSFTSAEQLDEMVKMGMEEGMQLALGQIDGILAERAA